MASNFETRFAQMQLGSKGRLRLYRKISGLLANGVSLQQALDKIYDQASKQGKKPGAPVAMAVDAWRRAYREGKPFGQALEGWAPVGERMLVEAGEAGSRLDEALQSVIQLNINSAKIRGALIGGLAYPVILLMMLGGVLYLFGVKVLPAFEELLPRSSWQGMGSALAKLVTFAQEWLIPTAVLVILLFVLWAVTLPRWTGGLRSKFDKIPPWSLYRLVAGGGFLMSVAALVNAGVAIPEVMRKLRRNSNPWMQVRIDAALREINQGANLGEALFRTGHGFPDEEIVDDLRIYASLASFDESLRVVADEWIETGVEKISNQAKVLNSIMVVAMGFTVMFLVGGLYAIQNQLTQAGSNGGGF